MDKVYVLVEFDYDTLDIEIQVFNSIEGATARLKERASELICDTGKFERDYDGYLRYEGGETILYIEHKYIKE